MRLALALSPPAPAKPQAAPDAELRAMWEHLRRGERHLAVEKARASLEKGRESALAHLCRHAAQHGRPQVAITLLALVAESRPDVLAGLAREPAFRGLRDDPRFLQLIGEL